MLYKIVLAEDNEAEAEIIKLIVEEKYKNKIELIHIDNGNDVINYVFNNDIDLILLDINLPGKNGKEIAKYIRNDLGFYYPIVILSTSDNESDIQECYKLFINSYMVKPIDYTIFEEMFDRIIQYWVDFNQGLKI